MTEIQKQPQTQPTPDGDGDGIDFDLRPYMAWIERLSLVDPKEMRQLIADDVRRAIETFSAKLLFYQTKAKPSDKPFEVMVRNATLEILGAMEGYLPPVEGS